MSIKDELYDKISDGLIHKKLTFSDKYTAKDQKRRKARIPVKIKGSFVYKDINNNITDKCLINSLSTGGISFMSGMVLTRGDVVVVTFPLGSEVITEYCKITRTHGKEVGCKFIYPSEENINLIQQYIYDKVFSWKKEV